MEGRQLRYLCRQLLRGRLRGQSRQWRSDLSLVDGGGRLDGAGAGTSLKIVSFVSKKSELLPRSQTFLAVC